MIKSPGLAERLRQATEALHLEAERSGFVRDILRKRASPGGYGLFLRNLEPAYAALERGLSQHADHPGLDGFDWPPLFRLQAITDDLATLADGSWQDAYALLPEATAYAGRIEQLQSEAPLRLLGHAYVRYIGDLSGGQIVKAILLKAPGLPADRLRFYDFDDIADSEAFKQRFRDQLDHVGEMAIDSEAMIQEALIAFRLNIDLSHAVQRAVEASGAAD
ncbi:MAG: biliverdin-producing heme oxygenase [Alphaproteobacteria bacterium]